MPLVAAVVLLVAVVVAVAWRMPWLPPCKSERRRLARVVSINSPYIFLCQHTDSSLDDEDNNDDW